jgi:hypothetical protein
MKRLLFFLGYIWSLPVTVIGLLAALVAWTKPVTTYRGTWVLQAKPGGIAYWFLKRFGKTAYTWGAIVTVAPVQQYWPPEFYFRLLNHERRHMVQAMWFGPLMPLVYVVCSVWAWVKGGAAYRDNILEADAREHANDET